MSRRTSEASKAIRAAWQREQKLVSEGKGTRDWTPEQQKEILELGKAYYHSENPADVNDGKAFEGHHMKSAEAYPEYQRDHENIQFLSRPEHQEAHGGDYRNPTNGYFDPVTKLTQDFGDNKYESCEIIKLTDSIVCPSDVAQVSSETTETFPKEDIGKSSGEEVQRKDNPTSKRPSTSATTIAKTSPKVSKSFGEKIMDAVKGFDKRHPVLTGVLKVVGVATVAAGTEAIANSGKGLGRGLRSSSSDEDFSSSFEDDYADSLDTEDYDDSSFGRDYPDERSSPKGHTVPAHGQHYHTKSGVIWKEKGSYPRGGKHSDD